MRLVGKPRINAYNGGMGEIRNVVFDLGGVMINYNPGQFIADMGYTGKYAEELRDAIFYNPLWQDMDIGRFENYEEALPEFVKSHPDMEKDIRRFFQPDWFEVYTLKQDTERILYDWVYDKGYDIYILSNFSKDGFTYVENKYPFFKKAKGKVVSAFEKCIKPQPEIYRILLDRYGLKPEESVFIDDFQVNVDAAIAMGMKSIRFVDPVDARNKLIELGVGTI
jgi:putative hydrolase of the HAD superfamily